MIQETFVYTDVDGKGHRFAAFTGTPDEADTFAESVIARMVSGDCGAVYARFDATCGENFDLTGDWMSLLFSPQSETAYIYNADGAWQELDGNPQSIEEAFACYFSSQE